MRRTKTVLGLSIVLALIASACTVSVSTSSTGQTLPLGTTPPPRNVAVEGALAPFEACDAFLDYVISHAVEMVGPYGLDQWFGGPGFREFALDDAAAPTTMAAAGAEGTFSGTNVQVEGVDEPDIVKTDGDRIVLMSEGTLIVVDVTGDAPVEIGRLAIGDLSAQTLFLSGDHVLLFGSIWNQRPIPLAQDDTGLAPVPATPTVRIVEVDISGDPEVERTMDIDGAFISGRMVDDSARLVISSGPVGFEWSYPAGSGLRAEREAIEANKQIIRDSGPENWIPYYVITDADGDVESEGTLFDCAKASHPDEFSGLDMLSIVTLDVSRGLDLVDSTGLLATGHTVYASPDNLYVATNDWQSWRWLNTREGTEPTEGPSTEIHRFDISDPAATTYVASGAVQGYLLNQFAMDEHRGMLRVASTTTPAGWGSGTDSKSRVTVLRKMDDSLVPIGILDGLGASEQIYSVRFLGDVGYVVTFRQTDPLYTIDLSDPANPELVGELKIPGYSAYLHPLGGGLLMGVGQDATDQGRVQGTQVSVFDVRDASNPRRLDTYTLSEGSNSEVEYDHHAFLYWDGLAMIPVQQYSWNEKGESFFSGALGLRVGDDGHLTEINKVVHPGGDISDWDWRARIMRTVVVGDSVYTISPKGVMKSDLSSLNEEAWLGF